MTDCGCAVQETGTRCTCGGDGPPVDPFQALRVAYGMLLGEDDFRVLLGNPRGKQMLHAAWLHGSGVVWGMPVTHDQATDELAVGPGLAVDGRGRELRLEVGDCPTGRGPAGAACLTVRDWATAWLAEHPLPDPDPDDGRRRLRVWVVARYLACPDRPVPALADPCDVTRRHDDFSRWRETACLDIVAAAPARPVRFPRVRALLGLARRGSGAPAACTLRECAATPAGECCRHVAEEVDEVLAALAQADPDRRARVLLLGFRRLAARDVTERPVGDGEDPPLFPDSEQDADVVLARLTVEVGDEGDCVRVGEVKVDPWVRTALLPTTTIQELTCGFAPGLLGETTRPDAGGPRLVEGSMSWSRSNTRLRFSLDRPAAPGSQERAVRISSLSDEGAGWSDDGVDVIRLENDGETVVVDLDGAPAYPMVRVVVKGTGPTPLYGRDPLVPFAGVAGGPPGGPADGHDAVVTFPLGTYGRAGS